MNGNHKFSILIPNILFHLFIILQPNYIIVVNESVLMINFLMKNYVLKIFMDIKDFVLDCLLLMFSQKETGKISRRLECNRRTGRYY